MVLAWDGATCHTAEATLEIESETLRAVMNHVVEKAYPCEMENGRNLKDVIFRIWWKHFQVVFFFKP